MGVSPSVLCAADRQRRWIVEALPIGAAGVAPDRAVVVAFVQFHGAGDDLTGLRVLVEELPSRTTFTAAWLNWDVDQVEPSVRS